MNAILVHCAERCAHLRAAVGAAGPPARPRLEVVQVAGQSITLLVSGVERLGPLVLGAERQSDGRAQAPRWSPIETPAEGGAFQVAAAHLELRTGYRFQL